MQFHKHKIKKKFQNLLELLKKIISQETECVLIQTICKIHGNEEQLNSEIVTKINVEEISTFR